jgi:putative ABC transport system ATP-binding protein
MTSVDAALVAAASAVRPAVKVESVMHIYRTRDVEVVALRGADLEVATGETVALLGPSGSGKSTLLLLLAGLLQPSAGTVQVAGQELGRLGERQLLRLRRRSVGVLLQGPARNLLPYATVGENVSFAQRGTRTSARARRSRRDEVLTAVGLESMQRRRAVSLSGGEQQRLGLAIAVVGSPAVLLADEPTSQLDQASADQVAQLLRAARDSFGSTVIVVTHDERLAATFDRTVAMRDGRIGAQGRRGHSYAVVSRDGSVQLPAEFLGDFPPGTLVAVQRTERGVQLLPQRDAALMPEAAEGLRTEPEPEPEPEPLPEPEAGLP